MSCRWDRIQQLKDEKGHELLSTADVQSFLHSCEEAKAQLQGQLSLLNTVEVDCSSFTLLAGERNQAQALREIQMLEGKISYLRSVAKMYVLQNILSAGLKEVLECFSPHIFSDKVLY